MIPTYEPKRLSLAEQHVLIRKALAEAVKPRE
jgi:hypothetical protein